MVELTFGPDSVTFLLRGWSRFWALRSSVVVPLSAIRAVSRAPAGIGRGWWKGWRMPGTHVPGVIVAGSYYRDGAWTFWDVRGSGEWAIVVELAQGAPFDRLVVEVHEPEAEIARLRAAVARLSA